MVLISLILRYGCLGRILGSLAQGCFEPQAVLIANTLWMKDAWGLHAKQCWQVRDSSFCQVEVLNQGSHSVPTQWAQQAEVYEKVLGGRGNK